MPRELILAWAGRHQRSAWEDLCADYRARVERFVPVRDLAIRARTRAEDPRRRKLEAREIAAALPDPCWLIALDPQAPAPSSERFAADLARWRREWPHAIAFAIGSDLGLDPDLVSTARTRLGLGPLTLSHELARLVLYEQLYRALSIDAGMSYHRGSS